MTQKPETGTEESKVKLVQESGREDKDDAKNGHTEEQASRFPLSSLKSSLRASNRMTRDSSEMPFG